MIDNYYVRLVDRTSHQAYLVLFWYACCCATVPEHFPFENQGWFENQPLVFSKESLDTSIRNNVTIDVIPYGYPNKTNGSMELVGEGSMLVCFHLPHHLIFLKLQGTLQWSFGFLVVACLQLFWRMTTTVL